MYLLLIIHVPACIMFTRTSDVIHNLVTEHNIMLDTETITFDRLCSMEI